MSRIGLNPITIPSGVEVKIEENNLVKVKGPKGNLERVLHPEMAIKVEDAVITVSRPTETIKHKSLHGLTRTLINNMVVGVTEGYSKELEITGVGYRAQLQGKKLVLALGYSHPIEMDPPQGIEFELPSQTSIIVKGIDKELVGQIAANIRATRNPDPYQQKGVRYKGEYIRKKAGKTA